MRKLEQQGLRLIARITSRGHGAIAHEIAAVLGLSVPGAAVVIGRLNRAGYLHIASVSQFHQDQLITGLTAAGLAALHRVSPRSAATRGHGQ